MSAKLSWGILGTGSIAGSLAHAINASESGELVAVGSRTLEKAEAFAEKNEIPHRHGSYQEMLDNDAVEAVYISLPNHMHLEWSVRCAEAGKHILCEKPLASNAAEAMVLIEAARRHDVFLMEAFMYRCHPQTAKLVELIRDGAIGDVRVIQAQFSYALGPRYENIRLQNESAGGGIMDVGCYCMSMCRVVAGAANGMHVAEPQSVQAVGKIGETSRVDEWTAAVLTFPGDIVANVICGCQISVDATLRVWGTEGNIQVPNPWFPQMGPEKSTIILQKGGGDAETITAPGGRGLYTIEADTVAANIAARQAPAPCMNWEDSLGNMRALDQWRAAIGLAFDCEQETTLTVPYVGLGKSARPGNNMSYVEICGIDKPVSRIVMGGTMLNPNKMTYTAAMLDHYIDSGGNTIDTARIYGGAEPAVGKWFNLRNNRDDIILIGKGGHTPNCNPDGVSRELAQSLENLQTDYVDIYMLHRDNPELPVSDFIDCLNAHKNAGRMRVLGVSNWTTARIDEANAYAAANGLTGFTVSSPNLALAAWNEPMWPGCLSAHDPESLAWYEKRQMPLFSWSSQASGFLSGRYGPENAADAGMSDIARVWFSDENFERLNRVRELAKKKGVGPTQIALAWVLHQPFPTFPLVGAMTIEETRTAMLGLDVELTPDEMRWLDLA